MACPTQQVSLLLLSWRGRVPLRANAAHAHTCNTHRLMPPLHAPLCAVGTTTAAAAATLQEVAGILAGMTRDHLGSLLVHPGHATVGVYYLARRHQMERLADHIDGRTVGDKELVEKLIRRGGVAAGSMHAGARSWGLRACWQLHVVVDTSATPRRCAPHRYTNISDSVYPDRFPILVQQQEVVKVGCWSEWLALTFAQCTQDSAPHAQHSWLPCLILHLLHILQEADIAYLHNQVHKLQPGFYLALDRTAKRVLWVVRGTHDLVRCMQSASRRRSALALLPAAQSPVSLTWTHLHGCLSPLCLWCSTTC